MNNVARLTYSIIPAPVNAKEAPPLPADYGEFFVERLLEKVDWEEPRIVRNLAAALIGSQAGHDDLEEAVTTTRPLLFAAASAQNEQAAAWLIAEWHAEKLHIFSQGKETIGVEKQFAIVEALLSLKEDI